MMEGSHRRDWTLKTCWRHLWQMTGAVASLQKMTMQNCSRRRADQKAEDHELVMLLLRWKVVLMWPNRYSQSLGSVLKQIMLF